MQFEVIKSTQSNGKNGGFVTTIEANKTVKCPITGAEMNVKERRLIKTPVAAEVGKKVEIGLDGYRQREYRNTVVDQTTGEERELLNSWLHVKVVA